jgi:hypothetical protein
VISEGRTSTCSLPSSVCAVATVRRRGKRACFAGGMDMGAYEVPPSGGGGGGRIGSRSDKRGRTPDNGRTTGEVAQSPECRCLSRQTRGDGAIG